MTVIICANQVRPRILPNRCLTRVTFRSFVDTHFLGNLVSHGYEHVATQLSEIGDAILLELFVVKGEVQKVFGAIDRLVESRKELWEVRGFHIASGIRERRGGGGLVVNQLKLGEVCCYIF